MLAPGIALLFLIPGIAVYCALYGLFSGDGENIPSPPEASSIEAVAIVVFACIGIHLVTAGTVWALEVPCRFGFCLLVPVQSDIYRAAFSDMGKDASLGAADVAPILGVVAAQCVGGYSAARFWLLRQSARNALPIWIYGWTKDVLTGFDKTNCIVIVYVLTDLTVEGKSIVYAGIADNVALKSNGNIDRVNLIDAERYLVDLAQDDLIGPLSKFPVMMISDDNIKNVAFNFFQFTSADTVPVTTP